MVDIDFRQIVARCGGQREAFEEFCCQLASRTILEDTTYTRLHGAGGDGGIECFADLPDGNRVGWQAKYVFKIDSLLTQATKSLTTALNTHSALTRYVVCFPFDLTGPTARRGLSGMEKLDNWQKKQEQKAAAESRQLTIEAWPAFKLRELLLEHDASGGIREFFFNQTILTNEWFSEHLELAKETAGPRYVPELNVKTELWKWFAAFGRTTSWSSELTNKMQACRKAHDHLETHHGKGTADSPGFRQFMAEYEVSFPSANLDYTRDAIAVLRGLHDWLRSPACSLAYERVFVLSGTAGSGKTHGICDAADQRFNEGFYTCVNFGHEFRGEPDPWTRLLETLGLSVTLGMNGLLDALNAVGEASGSPLILCIDAINETRPLRYWRDRLPAISHAIQRRPYLRLCITCRTPFILYCLPDGHGLPILEHPGFTGIEHSACQIFFEHYELDPPIAPVLQPELSNPLYLRLVCETLRSRALRRLPSGWQHGIAPTIRAFLQEKEDGIPALEELLSVMQRDGQKWHLLVSYPSWGQRDEDADRNSPYRQVWMHIESYLVQEQEVATAYECLHRRNFFERWMPEGASWLYGFAGEYPWGTPFNTEPEEWHGRGGHGTDLPVAYDPCWNRLAMEWEYDASVPRNFHMIVPARTFFSPADLWWDGQDGYRLINGRTVFRDPSVTETGPASLLADADDLQERLNKLRLRLVWTLLGEKWILGGPQDKPTPRRTFSQVVCLREDGSLQIGERVFFEDYSQDIGPRLVNNERKSRGDPARRRKGSTNRSSGRS